MIVLVGNAGSGIGEYHGLSTDDKAALLATFTKANCGSTLIELDTGNFNEVNETADGTALKWYTV